MIPRCGSVSVSRNARIPDVGTRTLLATFRLSIHCVYIASCQIVLLCLMFLNPQHLLFFGEDVLYMYMVGFGCSKNGNLLHLKARTIGIYVLFFPLQTFANVSAQKQGTYLRTGAKSILPANFEQQMFLHANSNLRGIEEVKDIMNE